MEQSELWSTVEGNAFMTFHAGFAVYSIVRVDFPVVGCLNNLSREISLCLFPLAQNGIVVVDLWWSEMMGM